MCLKKLHVDLCVHVIPIKCWPQHVHKAAFPVLTSPVGLEGSLPEIHPGQAPASQAMGTFWRRHLQSGDF